MPAHIQIALRKAICCAGVLLLPAAAFAGQGVQRMLYTSPNMAFVAQPTGGTVVTVSDSSGLMSTLQTSINSARAANPSAVLVIQLLTNATYSVSTAGIVLGSHECLSAAGATISPAVTVTVKDAVGNAVTASNASVSLALPSNSGGVLSGGGAAAASSGVATFASLQVNKAGTYTLIASAQGLPSVTSSSFAIAAVAGPARYPAWRILTEVYAARTWRELGYLVLSYLVGGIGLAYVLTAAYAGALLVVTVVGLPLVGVAVLGGRLFGRAQRWMAWNLLGDAIPAPSPSR